MLRASDEALPNAVSVAIGFPRGPKGVYVIQKRVPQDQSSSVHSSVYVDQFSGKVLKVEDFNKISAGYRAVRINRSIHTGDYWGLALADRAVAFERTAGCNGRYGSYYLVEEIGRQLKCR